MTPERHAREREIFNAAVHLPAGQQDGYLENACQGDADLLSRVRALLAADREATHSMDPVPQGSREESRVLPRGYRLGPYEIEEWIGRGATGHVYRGRDTRLGRQIAIKVLHGGFSSRFEREARLIASLKHPNICTLYDIGPNFLVMELLEGSTLKERLEEGPLSWEAAIDLTLQLAEALEAAHAQGIVHRDIKPANIFVDHQGKPTILDFGLAKLRIAQSEHNPDGTLIRALDGSFSVRGQVIGTPSYMAPEQALGSDADARSDLFSLAVVLYEMATGVRCFDGNSVREVLLQVIQKDPEEPSRLNPDLPPMLDAVLQKALEKDPERRYQGVAEFRAELDRVRSGAQPRTAVGAPGWFPSTVGAFSGWVRRSYRSRWWAAAPWPYVARFAGLGLLVLAGHRLFERSPLGQDFRQFESTVLQSMLGISHDPDSLPIIVNIAPARKGDGPTDRAMLDRLIRKLDVMQTRAIGVDIDFSPLDDGQPVTPEDWNYFHDWTQLSKDNGFELRLGVYRRATDIPAHWLGLPEFAHLAAGIATPSDDREYNFFSIRSAGNQAMRGGALLPMSVALYHAAGGGPVAERIVRTDPKDGTLLTARYRIDYSDSMLKLLAAQTVDYSVPEDLETAESTRKLSFRGKVVLVGDLDFGEDQFCRPFSVAPTSGLMAHAASLVTLRQGGLQDIEGSAAAWLDLTVMSLASSLLWVFAGWGRRSKAKAASVAGRQVFPAQTMTPVTAAAIPELNASLDLLGMCYCILIALLTGAAGLAIVRTNRIFWPDFLWIAGVLLAHAFVGSTLFPFFGGLAGEFRRMSKQVFSGTKGSSHAL